MMNEDMHNPQGVTSLPEQIRESVRQGRIRETGRLVSEAVEAGYSGEVILCEALIPGMKQAGNEYRMQEQDIPKLLCAARSMQIGMDTLRPAMETENTQEQYLGKAILGTVEGDLHEVGKNLVAIMFRSVGFEVIDLGVDVSEKQFLKAVREHPDAALVCISSLLTTSNVQMRRIVHALRSSDRGKKRFIMVGGGSVTESFAQEIGADAYTEDAVDAAAAAKEYILSRRRQEEGSQ